MRVANLIVGGLATLVAGCSVASIDVDVYKGPLADHERVQVQQMASMAIAARPLLIRLRDDLEVRERLKPEHHGDPAKVADMLKSLRGMTAYEDGFICEGPKHSPNLVDRDARFVNSVLYLYDDRSETETVCGRAERLVDRTRTELDTFEENWSAYLGKSVDSATWDRLYERLCIGPDCAELQPALDSLANLVGNQFRPALEVGLSDGRDRLINRYRRYLGTERPRSFGDPMRVINGFLSLLPGDLPPDTDRLHRSFPDPLKHDGLLKTTLEPSQIAANLYLAQASLVREHARVLFAEQADQEAFVRLVTGRAQAYIEARQASRRLFRIVLQRIKRLPPPTVDNASTESEIGKALIAVAVQLADRSKTSVAASYLQATTAPGYLRDRDTFAEVLSGLLSRGLQADNPEAGLAAYTQFLTGSLTRDPQLTAELLLKLDVIFGPSGAESLVAAGSAFQQSILETGLLEEEDTSAARTFGIVRVPKESGDKEGPTGIDSTELTRRVDRTTPGGVSGLDKGRLDIGINRLTEEYLQAQHATPDRTTESPGKQKLLLQLTDVLSRFANKVLFVVNNDSLFADSDGKIRSYTLVLQTVGNTIRVQADELRQRRSHEERLAGLAASNELAAIRNAIGSVDWPAELIHDASEREAEAERQKVELTQSKIELTDLASQALSTYAQTIGRTDSAQIDLAKPPIDSAAAGHVLKTLPRSIAEREQTLLLAYQARRGVFDTAALLNGLVLENPRFGTATFYPFEVAPDGSYRVDPAEPGFATVDARREGRSLWVRVQPGIEALLTAPAPAGGAAPTPIGQSVVPLISADLEARAKALKEGDGAGAACTNPTCRVIESAAAYLKKDRVKSDLATSVSGDDAEAVIASVYRWTRERRDQVGGATVDGGDTQIAQARMNLTQASTSLMAATDAAEQARQTAVAAKRSADQAAKDLDASAAEATRWAGIRASLETLIKETSVNGLSGTAADLHERLIASAKAKSRDTGNADREKFKATATYLGTVNPSVAVYARPALAPGKEEHSLTGRLRDRNAHESGGKENARDVLDRIIALLRQEHTQAVRSFGKGSARARKLSDALATAYEQRASMTFIRPASAYLRSVHTATTLQDNRVGWRNTLDELWIRSSMPFAGLGPSSPDQRTLNELDRQFWQNINRVRLTGGGQTNYVIAKDDVGNWYVKDYAADPEDVIRSAAGLARFAIGQNLGANLLDDQGEVGIDADGSIETQPTQMERLFERYTNDFREATVALYVDLGPALGPSDTADSVAARVLAAVTAIDYADAEDQQALQSAVTNAETTLAAARGQLNAPLADDPAEATEQRGQRIVSGLRALRAYRAAAIRSVRATRLMEDERDALTRAKGDLEGAQSVLEEAENELRDRDLALTRAENVPQTGDNAGNNANAVAEARTNRDDARDARDAARAMLREAEEAEREAKTAMVNADKAERAAVIAVDTIVLGDLDQLADRRIGDVVQFENSITFIGDTFASN